MMMVLMALCGLALWIHTKLKDTTSKDLIYKNEKELYSFSQIPNDSKSFNAWNNDKNLANRQRSDRLLALEDEEIMV